MKLLTLVLLLSAAAFAQPVVTVQSPQGETFQCGISNPVLFSATASDPTYGDVSGSVLWVLTFPAFAGPWANNTTKWFDCKVYNQQYAFQATATNPANISGSSYTTVTVEGTSANGLDIRGPAASVACGSAVIFRGDASDATKQDVSSQIQWADSTVGALGVGQLISHTYKCNETGTHTVTAVVPSTGATGFVTFTVTKKR